MNQYQYPCQRGQSAPLTRRAMLSRCASGFGGVALAALGMDKAFAAPEEQALGFAGHGPHHQVRAKNVIFLYMDGGPSQIDTFDPKPMLDKHNGEDPKKLFKCEPTQFNSDGVILASPWKFKQHGESGIPVSSLFPHVAECVDELAVIRSMTSEFPEHTFANYFLHTGSGLQGRPSMGAWFNYGLGSECSDLPGFVVLNGGLVPPGGLDCFGNGFLPASYQGSIFKPSGTGIANISPSEANDIQSKKLALAKQLDGFAEAQFGKHDSIESAIRNYELAYEMQVSVPDVMSLAEETAEMKRLYGMESKRPMSDRSADGRKRSPLRGTDLPQSWRRSMGPTRRPQVRPPKQCPSSRSADRGAAERSSPTRDA